MTASDQAALVSGAWNRYLAALAQKSTKTLAGLQPGQSETALRRVENALAFELPLEVHAFYARHAGEEARCRW